MAALRLAATAVAFLALPGAAAAVPAVALAVAPAVDPVGAVRHLGFLEIKKMMALKSKPLDIG